MKARMTTCRWHGVKRARPLEMSSSRSILSTPSTGAAIDSTSLVAEVRLLAGRRQ